MHSEKLVLIGSARKESDTLAFVNSLYKPEEIKAVNLLDYTIEPYTYDNNYSGSDQFIKVAELLLQHQVIVFATPVYWYTMSGLMKVFFDRLTNLTDLHKPIGKQLKGKEISVVAVGTDPELPPGFEVPFRLTAQYFDMQFTGCVYRQTKG